MKKEVKGQKKSSMQKKVLFRQNRELQERLINARVVQKDLLYVIGLSPRIANKATLAKPEFLGQYGAIVKILVNNSKPYNASGALGPSYSAYVTYSSAKEATLALLSIDQFDYDDRLIRASFGTTKFCTHFLNDEVCTRPDCVYLHHLVDESLMLSKEDMTNNALVFYEQQKNAFYGLHFDKLTPSELNELVGKYRPKKSQFPPPDHIFRKKFQFLPVTLEALQAKVQSEKKQKQVVKKVEIVKKPATISQKSETPAPIKTPIRQKTKLGVILEDKSKSDTDSDNSFIIPSELNDIITQALSGKPSGLLESELEFIVESAPITKREMRESRARTKWVEELTKSDPEKEAQAKKTTAIQSIAQSPLLLAKLSDFIPSRERHSHDRSSPWHKEGYNTLNAIYDKKVYENSFSLNNNSEDEVWEHQIQTKKHKRGTNGRKSRDRGKQSTSSSTHSQAGTNIAEKVDEYKVELRDMKSIEGASSPELKSTETERKDTTTSKRRKKGKKTGNNMDVYYELVKGSNNK